MRNDWLAQRLKELGKTGQGLANALSVNKSRVSEIIGGRRGVKADEIIAMALYLEMNERDVIALLSGRTLEQPAGFADAPNAYMSSPPRTVAQRVATLRAQGAFSPEVSEIPQASSLPLDVPVYGTAVGGEDADFEMNGDVIDRVRRPAGLANAKNAFALYVVGTSMSPRYDEGDLIFVHPGRPPVGGCDVVVELHAEDERGRNKALLKTYRGKTPNHLLLSQLNPCSDFDIPLDQVKQVLRVLRTNELLGI
jgi:phage repressor protein C with HTH and peptisase S24 domain